ncbi:hypothetical protein VM1G_11270 [Cytospora mali]|uniref:Uncharacterized protein n=1 Tax=Cytospora mali TaxID=578113 RepID=A0A194VKN5_CYTMA|nr:hypothetical protein VM1G_11270 [Valsa mali]
MIAINSALSSRSTLAASTVSHVAPCFKLPVDAELKRLLRRDVIISYIQAISLATFRLQVQEGAGKAQDDK